MARIDRGEPVSAERAGGRGKRDPALRARIQRGQTYDDNTPEGEVAVRPVEPEVEDGPVGEEINLDELSDEEYADLVARGVIADGDGGIVELEIDPQELVDDGGAGDMHDPDYPLVLEGDVLYGKVTHAVKFDDDPSYFTYGIATRVQSGETEEEAFDRVNTIVNTRSLDLAYAAEEHIESLLTRVHQRRAERNSKTAHRALRSRETDS